MTMETHRYALLDRAGKTRGTTTSPAGATLNAEAKLVTQRKGRGIPPGWRIVDRGPTEPTEPKLDPSAFKVGDSIRLLGPHWIVKGGAYPAGTVAELVEQIGENPIRFHLNLSSPCAREPYQFTPNEYTSAMLEHLPAARETTTIGTLTQERDDARHEAATERERAEVAERDARACAEERDRARLDLESTHKHLRDAEARLADLQALHRAIDLTHAEGDSWHLLHYAMGEVLGLDQEVQP